MEFGIFFQMIKILLADDHQVFRDGIASILEDIEDMSLIAQAKDGREVLDQLQEHQPDLILICLLYTSPSPRDRTRSRMPSSA